MIGQKKKIRYGHSLCYLVISTEVHRKYYKASFEVSKGSFATLSFTRQNCLHMALDIRQASTLGGLLQKYQMITMTFDFVIRVRYVYASLVIR